MTPTPCPPIEQLEALATLAPGDPRRAHVDGCARCRGHLVAYREFMSGAAAPGADLAAADAALAAALARASAEAARPPGGVGFWPRLLAELFAPALRPVWGLAALALVAAGALVALAPPPAPLLRGAAERALVVTEAPRSDASGVTLRWRAVSGARHYEVGFYAADLTDLAHVDVGTGVTLVLRPDSLPAGLPAHGRVLWQVLALSGGDIVARSRTQSLVMP